MSRNHWKKGTLDVTTMKPLGGLAKRVFDAVYEAGDTGMTDDELVTKLEDIHRSVSARRRALVKRGYLQDSERERITVRGKTANVWILGDGKALPESPRRPDAAELKAILALLGDRFETTRAWLWSLLKEKKGPKT